MDFQSQSSCRSELTLPCWLLAARAETSQLPVCAQLGHPPGAGSQLSSAGQLDGLGTDTCPSVIAARPHVARTPLIDEQLDCSG